MLSLAPRATSPLGDRPLKDHPGKRTTGIPLGKEWRPTGGPACPARDVRYILGG